MSLMHIPLVDLKAQYRQIAEDVKAATASVMESAEFILGEEVVAFEQEFAAFCGVNYCIGVANGTDAIQLACRALEIGAGDEAIVPANTFVATLIGVEQAGARVVLVDCDEDGLLNPLLIEKAITSKTKAIVPVHLYGQCVDVEAIRSIAQEYSLRIIEDAAQAHGASFRLHKAGTFGDIGCFSFYPGKNLGAYGDGGACTTRSPTICEKLRLLRNLGSVRKYQHEVFGINSRLDTIQAAILRVKLKRLNEWNRLRREHASYYSKKLSGIRNVILPRTRAGVDHVFHLYVIRVSNRDRVLSRLSLHGIGAGIHYPIPVHLSPAFFHLGYTRGSFPVAEKLAGEILSLPLYPELTRAQMDFVVEHLTTVLA